MDTVSNITFEGSITDTNGQIVTPVGDATSVGGALICNLTTGNLAYISENTTTNTDPLGKDFILTLTNHGVTPGGLSQYIYFSFGDMATGYILMYMIASNSFLFMDFVSGAPVVYNYYGAPTGYDITANNTIVLTRTSGVITLTVNETPCTKAVANLDGVTFDSCSSFSLGCVYDYGVGAYSCSLEEFKLEMEGSSETVYVPRNVVTHRKN